MTDWKAIISQHGQLVWHTAYRLVGNHADAADCFQETFLEAVKVARKEPVREWSALLRHLATARALDLLRVRYRERNRSDPLADPTLAVSCDPGPPLQAEANELADRLRVALAELPPQQAGVICLCRLGNMSYRETADRLGLDTNTVGVLLHRARKRLRELLVSVDAESRNAD